jgi:hypothetical protein
MYGEINISKSRGVIVTFRYFGEVGYIDLVIVNLVWIDIYR